MAKEWKRRVSRTITIDLQTDYWLQNQAEQQATTISQLISKIVEDWKYEQTKTQNQNQ